MLLQEQVLSYNDTDNDDDCMNRKMSGDQITGFFKDRFDDTDNENDCLDREMSRDQITGFFN